MNLIITCARHLEPETEEEIRGILEDLGDTEPVVSTTAMSGILTAKTGLDPFLAIKKTREKLLEEPWHIRYCLRLIPIQKTVETRLEDVEEGVEGIMGGISEGDTYRISIKKRDSGISSREWISRIAGKVPNRVSLENPDKIILIEVLGDKTGIAIISENDVLSVEKAKRSLAE